MWDSTDVACKRLTSSNAKRSSSGGRKSSSNCFVSKPPATKSDSASGKTKLPRRRKGVHQSYQRPPLTARTDMRAIHSAQPLSKSGPKLSSDHHPNQDVTDEILTEVSTTPQECQANNGSTRSAALCQKSTTSWSDDASNSENTCKTGFALRGSSSAVAAIDSDDQTIGNNEQSAEVKTSASDVLVKTSNNNNNKRKASGGRKAGNSAAKVGGGKSSSAKKPLAVAAAAPPPLHCATTVPSSIGGCFLPTSILETDDEDCHDVLVSRLNSCVGCKSPTRVQLLPSDPTLGNVNEDGCEGTGNLDRKRRLIGDEFYTRDKEEELAAAKSACSFSQRPTEAQQQEKSDPDPVSSEAFSVSTGSISNSRVGPVKSSDASGETLGLVEEASEAFVGRIAPSSPSTDHSGLVSSFSEHLASGGTAGLIVQASGPDSGGVILYNSQPNLTAHISNSLVTSTLLTASNKLGGSSFGIAHYGIAGGGLEDARPPNHSGDCGSVVSVQRVQEESAAAAAQGAIVIQPTPFGNAAHFHSSTLTAASGPGLAVSVGADMTSLLSHIKNEPEDLTGTRRESGAGLITTEELSHIAARAKNQVIVSTPGGPVVLSSSDINNSSSYSGGPPPTVVTSNIGGPSGGDHASAYAVGHGPDFVPFSDPGRQIYSSDPYRPDNELYGSTSSADFSANVPRPAGDVQYVQYYKGESGAPTSGTPAIIHGNAPANAAHMNSPDSGIGEPTNPIVPPGQTEGFDGNFPHNDILTDINRKTWNDYRQNEEKINIPKIFSPYGFKYTFEAATSSSQRREDDKITYINKGQFYGITLEYIPEPDGPPLKSSTVKTVILLVFREGKTIEEELKAWQFWHSRQHSVKQRILDADTKNSVGLVGCIEEVAHNALIVYWNPYESPAKVSLAVQCLSTDFSTQKGVKGLPLHIQIDTYDDPRNPTAQVYQRGYCQIKIFCDKGAERKARDEERRSAKRRMTTTGKRRLDDMYHTATERSEFYTMANREKPPILFTPTDDPEKAAMEYGTELPSFYASNPSRSTPPDPMLKMNGNGSESDHVHPLSTQETLEPKPAEHLGFDYYKQHLISQDQPSGSISPSIGNASLLHPPLKKSKVLPALTERMMIYVRQETEEAYTALHLSPPTVPGLIRAIESKYKINASNIRFLYRKSKSGIVAKIDDDMLRFYCNEDVFLMQVMVTEGVGGDDNMVYDITLSEV